MDFFEGKPRWSHPRSFVRGQRQPPPHDRMTVWRVIIIIPVESVLSKCSKYETPRVITASMVSRKGCDGALPKQFESENKRA